MGVADRHHHLVFQHAQQRTLHADRQGRDFIEKQRAAVGGLEIADLVAHRPGEGAAAIAEQFRLDQRVGHRAAIDGHKRLVARDAVVMDRPGEQFLARAAFADDHHVALDRRQLSDHVEQLGDRLRVADQIVKRALLGQLLGDDPLGAGHFAELQGPLHFQQHVIELHGLEEIIVSPGPHGRHRHLDRPKGRGHDDRRLRRDLLQMPQQRQRRPSPACARR